MRLAVAVLVTALLIGAPAAADCNPGGASCAVESGEYHISLPEGDGPFPALVMLHGAGGRGEGMVRMLGSAAAERGWAVIGPQGLRRPGSRFGSSWSFRAGLADMRDEAGFVRDVLNDAEARFPIDRARVVISGFSVGGSMAADIACSDPGIARAFAPVAGNFWRPHPEPSDCAGRVDMLHTHGWTDGTVPIEGRVFRGGEVRQGDVFAAMEIFREVNGCERSAPDEITTDGAFWMRVWTSCEAGSLRFAMHSGGHSVPRGWLPLMIDWFDALE